jgi:hypothetical protein
MLCYRCLIPGCDDEKYPSYLASWRPEAIPPAEHKNELGASKGYTPDQCHMYTPYNNTSSILCQEGHFSRNIVKCDAWIYEDNENTIVGQVNNFNV